VQTYLHLSFERATWWWRCFIFGASISFWFFLTITYHLLFELQIENVSTLIAFMVYQLLVTVAIALAAGTVSVFASFAFNIFIYKDLR